MRLNATLFFATVFLFGEAQAQDMNGFRTDNYNGVNGAFFNPANLGNSPFKVDVNLFGLNVFAGNKNTDFNFSTFSSLNSDSSSLDKQLGLDKTNSIMANIAIHLPSVSYSINDKTTVAFLSRTRMLFNITDFDGKLLNSINGEVNNSGSTFTIANGTNMRLNANVFSEFGISLGRVIYDEGNHFLKVGATVKYLAGVGNSYFQMNNLTATINSDSNGQNSYATNAKGSLAMGVGGLDVSNLDNAKIGFNAAGFGADLGAVYEYRPDNLSEENIRYLFKFSVALLDIGSIKYTSLSQYTMGYDVHIPAGQQFALDNFDGKKINDLHEVFDAHPQYFTRTNGLNSSSYRVALPHTLQLGGDVRATHNVYIAANAQIGMTSNESKPYNPQSVSSITITPRYESKMLAAYLPLHYNSLAKASIGFGFRAGPLFAGSSSIVSMMISKSKQADFYFGFRVGFKTKKKDDL